MASTFHKFPMIALMFGVIMMIATSVQAAEILSVQQAHAKAAKGELILLDIRTRKEWAETGVGQHALKISMHEDDFLAKLWEQTKGDKTKPIGFICAVGGRSSFVTKALEKRGFTNVYDVSEGMMGNQHGAGWLAKKLPLQ